MRVECVFKQVNRAGTWTVFDRSLEKFSTPGSEFSPRGRGKAACFLLGLQNIFDARGEGAGDPRSDVDKLRSGFSDETNGCLNGRKCTSEVLG